VIAKARHHAADPNHAKAAVFADLLRRFDELPPVIRRSTRALTFFEGCQLVVILASLVGFLFVDHLVNRWYTGAGLGALTLGSVVTTAYCVLAWFRDQKD
jgi:hypothetical protein